MYISVRGLIAQGSLYWHCKVVGIKYCPAKTGQGITTVLASMIYMCAAKVLEYSPRQHSPLKTILGKDVVCRESTQQGWNG